MMKNKTQVLVLCLVIVFLAGISYISASQGSFKDQLVEVTAEKIALFILGENANSLGSFSAIDDSQISTWIDGRFTNDLDIEGDLEVDGTIIVDGASTLTGAVNTGKFTEGGGCLTISATSTTHTGSTLTQAQMEAYNCFEMSDGSASSSAPAFSLTLPATSTMTTLLPTAGKNGRWVVYNGFGAAATTTTIVAGTGIDLQENDGQNVVIGNNNYGWIECMRKSDTDVVCNVNETIPGD